MSIIKCIKVLIWRGSLLGYGEIPAPAGLAVGYSNIYVTTLYELLLHNSFFMTEVE